MAKRKRITRPTRDALSPERLDYLDSICRSPDDAEEIPPRDERVCITFILESDLDGPGRFRRELREEVARTGRAYLELREEREHLKPPPPQLRSIELITRLGDEAERTGRDFLDLLREYDKVAKD